MGHPERLQWSSLCPLCLLCSLPSSGVFLTCANDQRWSLYRYRANGEREGEGVLQTRVAYVFVASALGDSSLSLTVC